MAESGLPVNVGPAAFAGTAEDYARHRPPYPADLLKQLLKLTAGRQRLLDLACGPGRIALAVSRSFEEVLAVDIEAEMIEVGRRLAGERGITNIKWQRARAEDLQLPPSSLDLIAIGEAFHRLDQRQVLTSGIRWLRPGGVLATMGGANILRGSQPWHSKVFEVAEEWTRDAFPSGWAPALPGSETEPAVLRRMFESYGFVDVGDYQFVHEFTWSVDGVLGYLRSMSVCSPAVLGARRAGFEAAVRSALSGLTPDGKFHEVLRFGLTVMRRPAEA